MCLWLSQKKRKGKGKAGSLVNPNCRPTWHIIIIVLSPSFFHHFCSHSLHTPSHPLPPSSPSFPSPSLLLSTGSTRLPNNKRQEVLENGTLVLREIEKVADDGSYSCRGSDGRELSTMRLIILGMRDVFSLRFLLLSRHVTIFSFGL